MRNTLRSSLFALALLLICVSTHAEELKDVPYSNIAGTSLALDAHIPDGPGPFPTAILVHGGGWIAGDKQQYITYIFQPLADARIAWFSINYRLAPQNKFPAAAEDGENAIEYVKKNAAKKKGVFILKAWMGKPGGGGWVAFVGFRFSFPVCRVEVRSHGDTSAFRRECH